MTRHLAIAAAALLAAIAGTTPAAAERLVTSISRHQVMVNSSFTGTSIVLFGTVEPDTPASRRRAAGYDLVVTVTGPKQTIVERRKERVLGIWTNIGSRTFLNVPSYLAVLSNQPFEQITNAGDDAAAPARPRRQAAFRSSWATTSATWGVTTRSAPISSA